MIAAVTRAVGVGDVQQGTGDGRRPPDRNVVGVCGVVGRAVGPRGRGVGGASPVSPGVVAWPGWLARAGFPSYEVWALFGLEGHVGFWGVEFRSDSPGAIPTFDSLGF
jgi:hypothetical protein